MRNLNLLILAAGLAAGNASAADIDVSTKTVGTLRILSQPAVGPVVDGPAADYRSDEYGRGAGYAAFANATGNTIFFEAGSMSSGLRNSSTSVTQVDLRVSGLSAGEEVRSITSTIFESTFGFFTASFGPNPPCSGAILPNCERVNDGAGFSTFTDNGSAYPGIAGADFAFDILLDGVLTRSVGGSLVMRKDSSGGIVYDSTGLGALAAALDGFELQQNDDYGLIYKWDRTDFTADFADPITAGETATVTYRITTNSWSEALPARGNPTNAIVSFACFADPLGRGSTNAASFARGMASVVGNEADATCDDFVTEEGEQAQAYTLTLGGIRDGTIVLTSSVVPEPAAWAMLITGFGVVGAAARRRRAIRA